MFKFIDVLPDALKALAKIIQAEAISLSKQEINVGKHSAEVSAGASLQQYYCATMHV